MQSMNIVEPRRVQLALSLPMKCSGCTPSSRCLFVTPASSGKACLTSRVLRGAHLTSCSALTSAQRGQLAAIYMQVAALAQRTLQERLHDLEILNEELVIAKNAMLSDLMVRLNLRDM